ncbi:MED22 [Lepeophtheirus salmonis]|uniref:MED22 n=1 Tax=Lepeophtheirus salmonis TaxID=72036 RepID=A0A7R8CFP0_LEPSM|nr:MED22 [Lepeophtheirus salmonis]CAF2804067.1 MED22 [Lepeophtheirus salmonis]
MSAYRKRAGEDLQRLYPQLEHITCVPEEPNITTELALNDFPSTNNLKAELKKTFSKTGESKQGFLTMMEAVHTQSRSCLTVNIYSREHLRLANVPKLQQY